MLASTSQASLHYYDAVGYLAMCDAIDSTESLPLPTAADLLIHQRSPIVGSSASTSSVSNKTPSNSTSPTPSTTATPATAETSTDKNTPASDLSDRRRAGLETLAERREAVWKHVIEKADAAKSSMAPTAAASSAKRSDLLLDAEKSAYEYPPPAGSLGLVQGRQLPKTVSNLVSPPAGGATTASAVTAQTLQHPYLTHPPAHVSSSYTYSADSSFSKQYGAVAQAYAASALGVSSPAAAVPGSAGVYSQPPASMPLGALGAPGADAHHSLAPGAMQRSYDGASPASHSPMGTVGTMGTLQMGTMGSPGLNRTYLPPVRQPVSYTAKSVGEGVIRPATGARQSTAPNVGNFKSEICPICNRQFKGPKASTHKQQHIRRLHPTEYVPKRGGKKRMLVDSHQQHAGLPPSGTPISLNTSSSKGVTSPGTPSTPHTPGPNSAGTPGSATSAAASAVASTAASPSVPGAGSFQSGANSADYSPSY